MERGNGPRRILLVGIGYVGLRLAAELVEAGHSVFGLRRSTRALPDGVTPLQADITEPVSLSALPSDIEQVVFAVSPAERSAAAYRAVYVDGLNHVRARLPQARVLLVSSTAVYGSARDNPITEDTPLGEPSPTSHELARAEQGLSTAHVVLRASGIYGPERTRLVSRLLHTTLPSEERPIVTNRIHRDDLARAIAFFIERPELGGVFNATDEEPASLGDMSDWLREQAFPPSLLPPPGPRAVETRPRNSRAISGARLRGLGFDFRYPNFREGYTAILSALGSAA